MIGRWLHVSGFSRRATKATTSRCFRRKTPGGDGLALIEQLEHDVESHKFQREPTLPVRKSQTGWPPISKAFKLLGGP